MGTRGWDDRHRPRITVLPPWRCSLATRREGGRGEHRAGCPTGAGGRACFSPAGRRRWSSIPRAMHRRPTGPGPRASAADDAWRAGSHLRFDRWLCGNRPVAAGWCARGARSAAVRPDPHDVDRSPLPPLPRFRRRRVGQDAVMQTRHRHDRRSSPCSTAAVRTPGIGADATTKAGNGRRTPRVRSVDRAPRKRDNEHLQRAGLARRSSGWGHWLTEAQGTMMRPGADMVPFWVWQALQSPEVCPATMSRSPFMSVTLERKGVTTVPV